MKKYLFLTLALTCFVLIGCSQNGDTLTGKMPPDVTIKIENEQYTIKLGTYCWTDKCVDTVGPIELLEGETPISVNPGQSITIDMDYKPQPSTTHLLQMTENNEAEVMLENNHFSAPTQQGIYYYSYGVWWASEKEENTSLGDAFYVFVLKVK